MGRNVPSLMAFPQTVEGGTLRAADVGPFVGMFLPFATNPGTLFQELSPLARCYHTR
jgi:hypothetical protein